MSSSNQKLTYEEEEEDDGGSETVDDVLIDEFAPIPERQVLNLGDIYDILNPKKTDKEGSDRKLSSCLSQKICFIAINSTQSQ